MFQEYAGFERALKRKAKKDEQDLSKVPGIAGHDYPIYHEFPHTSFDCNAMPAHPGIYANVETGCQVRVHFLHESNNYSLFNTIESIIKSKRDQCYLAAAVRFLLHSRYSTIHMLYNGIL
jgi:hypothetical protein